MSQIKISVISLSGLGLRWGLLQTEGGLGEVLLQAQPGQEEGSDGLDEEGEAEDWAKGDRFS